MRRAAKRSIVALLLAALAGWVGFATATGGAKAPTILTEAVRRGTLVQTVEATGSVESYDRTELAFDASGTVASVFVDVGSPVRAGQMLAVLDTAELAAEEDDARRALQAAQADLAQKNAGSTDEAAAVASAGVEAAQASLAAAQADAEDARAQRTAAAALKAAQVAEAATSLAHALADERSDLTAAMIAVRSGLSDADEVLGIDNPLANNDFQEVLSVLDAQALTDADRSFREAKRSRDAGEAAAFALTAASQEAAVDAARALVLAALDDAAGTLLYVRRVLDATSIDTADFSFADLSALKAKVDAARDGVQAAQDAVREGTQASEAAARALARARADEASSAASADAAVTSAQSLALVRQGDLARAKAELAQVLARPRSVDVAALAAGVEQARARLEAARSRLARAAIVSPIDGTVTRADLEVGERVGAQQAAFTVQTTDDRFRVAADIPESDVAKLSVGDRVDVTLDAYGEDTVFPGTVAEIHPAEKTVEGVVFYEAKVTFDDAAVGVKPGMSADLTVHTDRAEGALIVPQRAVLERPGGQRYVRVLAGSRVEERDVATGLRGDGGLVEVLGGLSEGEKAVVSIRE